MLDTPMTWVLERDVFANGDCIRGAASEAGHRVVEWSDEWWASSVWPQLDGPVLFHGSLGNAARIPSVVPWKPSAYCDTARFHCSTWYRAVAKWLLHERWEVLPASRFVRDVDAVMERLAVKESVFVRPDSPLKPFAGRVLRREQVSLAALDHGFYYDDPDLPVVVAPVRQVAREWRYVVAGGQVVAGSGYIADGRTAAPDDPNGLPWRFAAEVAQHLRSPEPVYVLDVCEADTGLRLLELNPFSGADLYGCSGADIVRRVAAIARQGV
jgi:ATP-grasp domain-containing protein